MLMCDHPLPVNFSEAKGGAPGRTILRRPDYVHFGSDPRRQNTQRRLRQLPRSWLPSLIAWLASRKPSQLFHPSRLQHGSADRLFCWAGCLHDELNPFWKRGLPGGVQTVTPLRHTVHYLNRLSKAGSGSLRWRFWNSLIHNWTAVDHLFELPVDSALTGVSVTLRFTCLMILITGFVFISSNSHMRRGRFHKSVAECCSSCDQRGSGRQRFPQEKQTAW